MLGHPHCVGLPARSLSVATLLLLLITTLALTSVPAAATTVAGRTAGAFAVSPTGAATYSIPIWAPPGPQGMQPHIALTYNSQQGNGYVGVGWSLSGLSSISRCNLTYAQDAAPGPVALSTSDGYCIDGQRLRLVSGTYGAAGSTYQTEVANFLNVTAYGASGTTNGPDHFIVQDRSGRTYTYGYLGFSQVMASDQTTVIAWMLSEVSDPYGNTMTIVYNTTTGSPPCLANAAMVPVGEAVPCTISWTASSHGSSSYNYTMNFVYGTNAAPPTGFKAGSKYDNLNLLDGIQITYAGNQFKWYQLNYTVSNTTGRDLLTSVEECTDTGASNCLLPTTFSYQEPPIGVSSTFTTVGTTGTKFSGPGTGYDFAGNGHMDLAWYNGTDWYVAMASGSGYGTPINTGITDQYALLGRVLANGTDGILARVSGAWWLYSWNGSSFTGQTTGAPVGCLSPNVCVLADVDGDGRDDLIELLSDGWLHTRLNTSTASAPSFSSTSTPAWQVSKGPSRVITKLYAQGSWTGAEKPRVIDFNGDGRADLLAAYSSTNSISLMLVSQGSTQTGVTFANAGQISGVAPAYFVDWNGDGCTDVITTTGIIYISACNGSTATTISLPSAVVGVIDWDGDGLADALFANGSTLGVYRSTGTSYQTLTTMVPYTVNTGYFAADVDADGLADLVAANSSAYKFALHNSAGQQPDLLTSATDGYGNSASPSYVSLAQNNYSEYADATYPDQNFIGPMYVVSQVTFSDPSSSTGGTYNQQFWYYGAWTNLQGRGFEGFYATRTYDSRNANSDYQYFERAFPYTGMKFQDIGTNANLTFYPTQWTGTPTYATLSSTSYQQRYFPYLSGITSYVKEVGGSENGDLITTTSTNYTFDDFGNATSTVKTVTDNDPASPYLNQTWTTSISNIPVTTGSSWPTSGCPSLFSQSAITYSASPDFGKNPVTSVTISKTLTPDTGHCDYTQIVTQPGTSYALTEALGYDNFGNVNSDTVSGPGLSGRLATSNWGTTGQFVNTLTDPSGAVSTWSYSSEQSLAFGVPDSLKDANNLTTSWTYDVFGRKIKEIRPDSTSTTWGWTMCAAHCGWGNSEYQIAQTIYQTDGSTIIRSDTTLHDPIDRVTQTAGPAVAGGNVLVQKTYNSTYSQGLLTFQQSIPFFSGSAVYQQTYSLDVLGRLVAMQRPINSSNTNPQSTNYAYAGRTTTVTDANGHAKTLVYDVNGWLRQVTDAKGYVVTIGYDAAGSRTSVTDNQGNTLWSTTAPAYAYGIAPMLLNFTDADRGTWTATSYDALGELTGWTDAKGQTFSAKYDALSRMTDRFEPDAAGNGLYTRWTWGTSASAHEIGQLNSVCVGTGINPTACSPPGSGYAESETYDGFARPYQRSIQIPQDGTYTYTRAYNSATGLLDTLTYPATPTGYQLKLQFAYSSGLLQKITDVNTSVALWTGTAVDARGHFSTETLGNGVVVNSTFDSVTGWLGKRTAGVGSGSSALQNNSYLFDYVGNLTQRQDNNAAITENVYPDVLNRLDHTVGDTNTNLTYDTTGRLATWQALGATPNVLDYTTQQAGCTYYANAQPHAVRKSTQGQAATSVCYDKNGNQTSQIVNGSQTASQTWTSYNQPAVVSAPSFNGSSTFSYDHNHQRWLQVASYNGSNETTEYIGGLLEKMTNSSGTAYRYYVPAGNNLIVYNDWNTSAGLIVSYVTTDHLGSSYNISDKNGNSILVNGTSVVNEKFSAMGWNENTSGDEAKIAAVSRHEFTGQENMDNVGMVNMNGRIFGASGGLTMLSPDPYIPDPTDTRSYNRYAYVNYNPLTLADPTGFAGVGDLPLDPWEWDCYGGNCGPGYANGSLGVNYLGIDSGFGNVTWFTYTGQPISFLHNSETLTYSFTTEEGYSYPVTMVSCPDCEDLYLGAPSNSGYLGHYNPATGAVSGSGLNDTLLNSLKASLDSNFGSFGVNVANAARADVFELMRDAIWIGAGELGGATVAGARVLALRSAVLAGNGSGITVLGSYPGYVALGEQLGANYFKIATSEWDALSYAEQRELEENFINAAVARGDQFRFANPPAGAVWGTWFWREVQMLNDIGAVY